MERKTLLAVAISFLFLMIYNSLVIAPQQKSRPPANQQITDSKGADTPLSQPEEFKDSDTLVSIGQFQIRFSTDRGSIKQIYSETYQYAPILNNFLDLSQLATFKSFKSDNESITFLYDYSGSQIQKTIKAIDNNRISIQIQFPHLSSLENVQFILFDIDAHKIKLDKNAMRESMLMEYSVFLDKKVIRKNNAFKFSDKDQKNEQKSPEWFGWRDRYHFAILEPEFDLKSYSVVSVDEHRLRFEGTPLVAGSGGGLERNYAFNFYVGPQDLELLKNLDGDLNKIMAFSGNSFLDAVEKFIYNALLLINKYTKNWGISIILISLLIYGATYPLTIKSMLSMRKMQELQPKMAELREKYKNDPQKLNTEVVQLYKIHNINPLAGCLPMLLQMPVFISLYQVLWRTHNFQGVHFLWIKDLSLPDRLVVFSKSFPFIGNELNILPFFMSIVMFFQQKMSSKSMVISDPSQEMQQKMMMYIFPIFIGGIFYHFASGLTLYFTIFYLLSTLTQYKMSKLNTAKK